MSARLAALVGLAERELELVHAGNWDALAPLRVERELAFAALPDPLPRAARPMLEQALSLQGEITSALTAGMAATKAELTALGRGRGAIAGYAGAGVAAAGAPAARTSTLDARS